MLNTIERKLTSANDSVTDRLDSLEQSLPGIPSKALAATRASVRRVNDVVGSAASSVWSRADDVGDQAAAASSTTAGQARSAANRSVTTMTRGVKQTTGQARAAADRTVDSVTRGVKETVGQARAQSRRTAGAVADNVDGALDDATVAADPSTLSEMSRSELYERAQELDIDGRSGMTKAELIGAIQKS